MSAVEIAPGTKYRSWTFLNYEVKKNDICYRFRCKCGTERVFLKRHVMHGAASMTQHCARCRLKLAKQNGFPKGNPKQSLYW